MTRFFVGKTSDTPHGKIIHMMIDKKKDILVVNIAGNYYAVSNICSHEGAKLHEADTPLPATAMLSLLYVLQVTQSMDRITRQLYYTEQAAMGNSTPTRLYSNAATKAMAQRTTRAGGTSVIAS